MSVVQQVHTKCWLRHRRTGTFWPALTKWGTNGAGDDELELRIPFLSYAAAEHKRLTLLVPQHWKIVEVRE